MTYAPAKLLEARNYLMSKGLPGNSLGIVGDTAHSGGYHVGNDSLSAQSKLSSDYSKRESPRDRPGSNAAMAFDVAYSSSPDKRLQAFSAWLVNECRKGAPDTLDIREVIYTLDGVTVHRWDRLGIRSTGDSSHKFHTHISYFRDSENRDKVSLFRRYFDPTQEDDMTPAQEAKLDALKASQDALKVTLDRVDGRLTTLLYNMDTNPYGVGPMADEKNELKASLAELKAAIGEPASGELVLQVTGELKAKPAE